MDAPAKPCVTLRELFDLEYELPDRGKNSRLVARFDDGSDREWIATGCHHAGDHVVLELSGRKDLDSHELLSWREFMTEMCGLGEDESIDMTCRVFATINGGDDLLRAMKAYRPSLETNDVLLTFEPNDPLPN